MRIGRYAEAGAASVREVALDSVQVDEPVRRAHCVDNRDAGFDEVYVAAIGPHYRELIELFRTGILADGS